MQFLDISKALLSSSTKEREKIEKTKIVKSINSIFMKYDKKPITIDLIINLQYEVYCYMKYLINNYEVIDNDLLDLSIRFNDYAKEISSKIK